MVLQLCKHRHKSLANPSLIHLFSTSQNDNNDNNGDGNNDSSSSSLNSYFGDLRGMLRKQTPQYQTKSSFLSRGSSKEASLEELRKNLAEFRLRSAVPQPAESNLTASQSQSQPQSERFSLQEPYKRNTYNEAFGARSREKSPYEAFKEGIGRAKNDNKNNNYNRGNVVQNKILFSLTDALKAKPEASNNASSVNGRTRVLPESKFGKEEDAVVQKRKKTEFVKPYSMEELGEKLRKLRPEEMKSGFSLAELSERLIRLREMEMKGESRFGASGYSALWQSINTIKNAEEEKVQAQIHILENYGSTQEYLMHPPKNHLVEKYFHPDNMSSAEKMKIELAKVREEFKMSESDCGSARVQIAQLTYRIKHLSMVLQKKDKHSRKGLLAMVQRRKRLLKYLRRTDWDSYCLVLSKLGLRDNPDYKSLS